MGVGSEEKDLKFVPPKSKKPTVVTSLPELKDLNFDICHKQNKPVKKSLQSCF